MSNENENHLMSQLSDEIRFSKTQQMKIINYCILLLVGIIYLNNGIIDNYLFKHVSIIFSILILLTSLKIVHKIVKYLQQYRKRQIFLFEDNENLKDLWLKHIFKKNDKNMSKEILFEKYKKDQTSYFKDITFLIPYITLLIIVTAITIFFLINKIHDTNFLIKIKYQLQLFPKAKFYNTVGLCFDLVGAVLIAFEVVNKFKGEEHEQLEMTLDYDKPPHKTEEYLKWVAKKYLFMSIGLLLLLFGFILQIVSNWM